VAITDEIIGISQSLGASARAAPKSTPMPASVTARLIKDQAHYF